jgi:hypothetical protein
VDPARLTAIESRLSALEQRSPAEPASLATLSAGHGGTFESAHMPSFHTSAAHKMYQYWPRLRINLTLQDFDPLQFQHQASRKDTALQDGLHAAVSAVLPVDSVRSTLRALYDDQDLLPPELACFLKLSPIFSESRVGALLPADPGDREPGYEAGFRSDTQPLEVLLLLSLSFRYSASATLSSNPVSLAVACMQLALAGSWTLSAQADDYRLTVKLMIAAQLTKVYGRPFHALGILKEVGHTLHLARSRLPLPVFSLASKIHCILERSVKLQRN